MANPRVFISYAFIDEYHSNYLFAQRFANDLCHAGADVIVDPADVDEQAFVQHLNRVLPTCQWLIVVQSPEAMQSLRVQMSVSTALHLVAQHRMQDVLVVSAAPCNAQEVPPAWESLTVFDATQDYMKALARVLLDLDLKEMPVNTTTLLSSNSSPTLQNDVVRNAEETPLGPTSGNLAFTATSTLSSLEDRPVAPPISAISLKREPLTASSKDQGNRPADASSASWSLPKVASWSPGSRQTGKRPKIFLIALVMAVLLVIGSTGVFYFFATNSNHQSSVAYSKTATSGASVRGVSTATTTSLIPSSSISITTTVPTQITGSTPTAVHHPTATRIPATTPIPGSTIRQTQCGNSLVTPWVALYQYSQFGGRQICFTGVGFINLSAYGFDKQTMAINIAANGVFFDQANGNGNQLGFYYGDEQSDLGSWDNRISSFRVDS